MTAATLIAPLCLLLALCAGLAVATFNPADRQVTAFLPFQARKNDVPKHRHYQRLSSFARPITPSYSAGVPLNENISDDGNVENGSSAAPIEHKPSIILPPSSDYSQSPSSPPPPSRGIVVVDPFFHSERIIYAAINEYEIGVVRVLSPYMARGFNKDNTDNKDYEEEEAIDHMTLTAPLSDSELENWLDEIPFPITAVICESDSGLDYAEGLACSIDESHQKKGNEQVSFYHNGYNIGRRDKFEMNEVCRAAGVDVAKQAACKSAEEAVEKAKEFGIEDGAKIIIKPRRGVASDRVSLCSDVRSVRDAAEDILSSTIFGTHETIHESILLQEYVPGIEFAVDVVSRHGEHKVSSIWVYERVSTADDGDSNPFAYRSSKLVSTDDTRYPTSDIIGYVQSCLNALNIRFGMTHSEVKVSPHRNIRLMEVNVRQQNDNIWPMSDICIGYNALDLCLSAYLDEEREQDLFGVIPPQPILRRSGMVVSLVCYAEGIVERINHIDEIKSLDSYVAMEIYPGHQVGSVVGRSKDIRTDGGWIHLIHEDEDHMMKDYERICELMYTMFQVEGSSGEEKEELVEGMLLEVTPPESMTKITCKNERGLLVDP